MEAKVSLNVVKVEKLCDPCGEKKLQYREMQEGTKSLASDKVHCDEKSLVDLGAKVGECNEVVHGICKHLPKLLSVRLVNKKWCEIASNILQTRSNIRISLTKEHATVGGNRELVEWSNVNAASKNNSTLSALDRLLTANSNFFPCQNYWISVGVQGSSGTPSSFIVKWIHRIKSLHFDVQQLPFVLLFENFVAPTGFVAVQNVQNLQLEHGPYDWGLPREVVHSTAPRLDRLKKLTLPGNLICDQSRWSEVLREAVNLERIENCTFPFLPEIVNQKKTSLVKSIYLGFSLKPNPAVGLTLQENVNVFVQAVQQGLQVEDVLKFDIEVFISPRSRAARAHCQLEMPEKLPPPATLNKWYKDVVQAFNGLLKNSAGTLQSFQDISCFGYPSKGTQNGGCLKHVDIPRMTEMREIDWLQLHKNSNMKMDLLFPLENGNFLASRCFPNIKEILCDPSKECWASLSLKSSTEMEQLTGKLSMPSASRLFWFCNNLDSIGHYSINRNGDCNLIQHLLCPIFPNLTVLNLHSLVFSQIPNILTKVIQAYWNTLQELHLTNRRREVAKQSKTEMWCLDVPVIGWPQSFLSILRENVNSVHVETVHQLLETRTSIRTMKCLKHLSFDVYDPDHHCGGGNIPLISELSQIYGFESLPQLKLVTVGNAENRTFDSDGEPQQDEFEDGVDGEGYYRRYRYCQQPKEKMEPVDGQEMIKDQLLFLKKKIDEKAEHLKRNSEMFRELKSVLIDVERYINSI